MSFYLKKNMSQKHVCPCKVLEKSMPQTIDSSSKNDMYIMDFPTAHRLRHKKTTAAQVTTLTLYHSASQSNERKSPAHVRTPSVISPEPLPKRPENPSRATAVVVGHVHRGLRRDQLLDHGGMAFLSRAVQPRQASVPGMRGGRRGSCSCRRQTRHSYGMFLRVVGQSFFDIGHRQKICHPILLVCGIGEKQEQSSQISHVTCVFTRDLTSSCNILSQHHEWLV